MAWSQLTIDKPHLVYIILGGFTSMFMLVSLFIKEKLYIGEATVATICGVIFGPYAANLINPMSWGNTDQITLEFSRIVLVVQCFAVGVELPKAYMERHWKSVALLLIPNMTFGWLMTSLFIWWMIVPLSWLESLVVAACVTATDPVLASSVVGKGKFAKRVPKHLRDLLSAESGCNDGMAFPFIYLSLYLLRYHLNARQTIFHWTCYTILYECIFGAFYGFMVGYIGRRAIRAAERAGLIDRESFLVFYFVLALFCAGSGSLLGMDDLLIGFSAGVGFSNDGSYTEKTEESHVSNVIDLLLNLAYFVYFGTIVPWDQFNAPAYGITPWRLVVIGLLALFFRRIPALLMLKPVIPDVKTWREALFAGHFGPIGVGAIYAAILARAELETDASTPLAKLPPPGSKEYELILLVWPIVTFLVITSIVVHGSSIAVFTLGRRINTLALTLSYTKEDEGPSWMNRLPRISSQSKSMGRADSMSSVDSEKLGLPIPVPQGFLRREGDTGSRPSSVRGTSRRRRKRDSKHAYAGGPIDPSAIGRAKRGDPTLLPQESGSDTLQDKSQEPSPHSRQPSYVQDRPVTASPSGSPERKMDDTLGRGRKRRKSFSPTRPAEVEAYQEGHNLIIENEEGEVLRTEETRGRSEKEKSEIIEDTRRKLQQDQSGKHAKHTDEPHSRTEGEEIQRKVAETAEPPHRSRWDHFGKWRGWTRGQPEGDVEADAATTHGKRKLSERKKGAAHAYQFGNTLIVEDEDGEVIRKYTIPPPESEASRKQSIAPAEVRKKLSRLGTFVGLKPKDEPTQETVFRGPEEQEKSEPDESTEASPEKAPERPTPQRGSTTHRNQLRKIDEDARKRETESDDDDDNRLRITISKTDRYGWTGLHKEKSGQPGRPGPLELGGGRRMSVAEVMKHLQSLDARQRNETVMEVEDPGMSRGEAAADRQGGSSSTRKRAGTGPKAQSSRPQLQTGDTSTGPEQRPGAGRREPTDYFSPRSRLSPLASPDMSTPMSPSDGRPTPARQAAMRQATTDTMKTMVEDHDDEEDVPGVDMRAMLARHVGEDGNTAAEQRRRRFNTRGNGLDTIRSTSEDEGQSHWQNEGEEPETAAEKRRRLAALGYGDTGRDEDSSSEEENIPRVTMNSDAERGPAASESGSSRPRRLHWSSEIGRERELTQERDEAERTRNRTRHVGGLKGLFKR